MDTAPDPSVQTPPAVGVDLPASPVRSDGTEPNDDAAPVDSPSTRLMLTTAAHFVQQRLHSQLAGLGLTPLDLSVLSGLAELSAPSPSAIATQCLLSESITEQSLAELTQLGFVEVENGVYSMTAAGSGAFEDARALEDALFAERSTTLRMELSSLISRLRDGGVLETK